MSTPIYPMAMKPRTNITFKLFFLSFPKEWKELMVKLQLSIDPKFNTMYNLKTSVLYGYLNGWMDDVVQINPIKQNSDDSKWYVSLNEPDVEKICEIIQIWIAGEYLSHYKKTEETEIIAEELTALIEPEVLRTGIGVEETVMFDPEGRALTDYAFNAFALYAANALNGKTISWSGQELTLSSCGLKLLMSQPISDGRAKPNYYSIGLQLSVQTTPPERTCMLLIDCSVKRFISEVWKKNIYINEDIHAYISLGNNRYRTIPLKQKYEKADSDNKNKCIHYWNLPEQSCYNLYNPQLLPNADDVLYHPEQYLKFNSEPQILLPYKFGMDFANERIGTGLSVKDKHEIFSQLSKLMKEFADMAEPAQPIKQSKAVHNTPSSNTNKAELQRIHRERLKQCTEMSELRIEIYGHSSDHNLLEKIKSEFESYLGGEEYQSVFHVDIVEKELGSLSDMMEDGSFMSHCQRIEAVKKQVPRSDKIVGAIVILPDMRDEAGDPKYALRAGFAETNRITQFITPDGTKKDDTKDGSPEHRVNGAVMDMLRQFGYTEFYEKRGMKNNPAFDADTVGMYVLHQLKPLWAEKSKLAKDTARFMPVYVTYNVRSGKVSVDSDLLEKQHLSYPEALIAFSKLSQDKKFVQKCVDSSRSGFRTKLLGLQSLYNNETALILSQANGITRQFWHGLTDKKISEYHFTSPYIPDMIEIGTKNYSDMRSFCDTGLRIMRIRENHSTHEVPDYYSEFNDKGNCISASGVYRYKNVFWGLESRPNNREYILSYISSKINNPSRYFDECGLVEFYPIQLQVDDDAEQWASYVNYLREVMPEVNRSVRLPAPLHFASKIEEYLLLVKHK